MYYEHIAQVFFSDEDRTSTTGSWNEQYIAEYLWNSKQERSIREQRHGYQTRMKNSMYLKYVIHPSFIVQSIYQ